MQVLVANEPRASREAICEALRMLRPGAEIKLGDPGSLEKGAGFGVFDLILHTGLELRASGPADTGQPYAMIDLHPGDLPLSHVEIDGERSTVPGLELGDILSIMDRFTRTAEAVEKR